MRSRRKMRSRPTMRNRQVPRISRVRVGISPRVRRRSRWLRGPVRPLGPRLHLHRLTGFDRHRGPVLDGTGSHRLVTSGNRS
ncbi:hypothetical protein FHX80_111156 [Streptomyces brevispora]|uniref:Uncharacterized protein n=1 Tax=Streptomyces brevispora TaxID=887462 RepID=A0A561UTP3_9ACTN|nr:hypothetical protein FHX80_111156 [Streptomyces brevispora]